MDALEEQADGLAVDGLSFDERDGSLEGFDGGLVLDFAGEARDDVAGEDDHGRAAEGLHGDKGLAKFGEEGVAGGRVGDAVRNAGGGIELNAEAFAGGVGAVEVDCGPVLVFADQFHLAVAGFGYFGEAVFEGEIVEDGPEHDGEGVGPGR